MTILFFSRFFHPHIGGVETHVLEVGKRFVFEGHAVTVVTEKYKENLEEDEMYEGIHIIRIEVGKENRFKKFRIWKVLWNKKKLLEAADIIHCHDVFFWYLPFRFLYPKKKVYTTFHGHETAFPLQKRAVVIRKMSEKLSFGNVCVGDYIAKWYGAKPTFVTYGGTNKMKNERGKIKERKGKIHIVFIGRLENDIGLDLYLETLEELQLKNISYEIIFIGNGSYKAKAKKYGTVVQSRYNDTYYHSVLQHADFVFASSYLSMLQAMVAKKLVFAVYTNQLKKDYLLLSPFAKHIAITNNATDLSQKLSYFAMQPDETKKLTDNAFEWAKKQTWDDVVDIYHKLWNL